MFSSILVFLVLMIHFAAGQVTHNVTVGEGGLLTFTPNTVTAELGDLVQFLFVAKNHTVTQSTFAAPCTPLAGGFDSGFQSVGAGQAPIITSFRVLNTDPAWLFCRQTQPLPHCGKGMVFAVNPPSSGNTFKKFQAAAMATSERSPSTSRSYSTTPPPNRVTVTVTVFEPSTPTPTPTPSPQPVIHDIIVGANNTLTFTPTNITAQPNDIVRFNFVAKNHTATQSTFSNPCVAGLAGGLPGFDSGFMPVVANSSTFPTFSITINNTSPVWVYCKQRLPVGHCGQGMTFAINADPNGPNNYAAFRALAKSINGTSTNTTIPSSVSSIRSDTGATPTPTRSNSGGKSCKRITSVSAGFLIIAFIAVSFS